MSSEWTYVVDIALLSLFLGIATYLKRTIRFFQKFLVPVAIIAGFIGMLAGPEVLKLVDIDSDRMGTLIYHLMSVGFIALALKDRNSEKNKEIVNSGFFIVSAYVIQGIVGFGLSLLMVYTFFPNLFPPFGMLLPLGYGQGPGQAYSIGRSWEASGFSHGGNVGLTIATFGYLWACFGGVPLMYALIKRRKRVESKSGPMPEKEPVIETDSPDDIPLSESIDRISVQLFLIGIVYLVTYITLKGLDMVLPAFGQFGTNLARLLWGFSFIIGAVYAILLRTIFDVFRKKNIMVRNYPNNFLLQRIAGGAFDFMITASIAAISISILKEYLVPILVITTVGGIVTTVYIIWLANKVYKKDVLENLVAMYGMLTGTISTGLALLREVDPDFNTQAAKNLVLGSGVALFAGFPLMILLNVPIMGFLNGNPLLYFITLGALVGYFGLLLGAMFVNRER